MTESEREVWELLCQRLRPQDVLLANVRLTNQAQDHEADLIVLMPQVGIVVVEVKGAQVWLQEGGWHQSQGSGTGSIRLVEQARGNKYAVSEYVESDPRWGSSSRSRVRWAHSVVLPYSSLHEDFAMPDCPRWMVHDRRDLPDLAHRLADIPAQQESGHRTPSEDDIELILEILRGRHLPELDIAADARERESRADRLTQEQATLLQVTRLLHRVEVRGGAGSGKTVMALTQARELTRGLGGAPGQGRQRVALLCYSRGLAAHFKRVVATWDRKHRPSFVGTFAELGRSWGAPDGTRDDSHFWEVELPATMKELATGLSDGQRFDAVIVDEAQDFADSWWAPILGALRDEETTGNRHPVQIERGSDSDPERYWQSFWDEDDVFYGHVLGCKGLERRAVVLCINQDKATDRSRERLYVGLSRATDQLVVVGDPDVVLAMGGPDVARRLGIG